MRELFVTELVKEILGPRCGLREELPESPLSEYITGVLAPVSSPSVRDIDAESGIAFNESQEYEEETDDADIHAPPHLSPVLNPKCRPSSIGLSFMVEYHGGTTPGIDVCLTWSRYFWNADKKVWKREPRYAIRTIALDSDIKSFRIGPDGAETTPDRAEIHLHVLVRNRQGNRAFVTLYAVNGIRFTSTSTGDRVGSENHIFQPQIRVVCWSGTRVIPVIQREPLRKDEKELSFLYRRRPILARGHLCSAVWKDVDLEKPYEGRLDFPDCVNQSPFRWPDGDILPEQEKRRFVCPDVRTDFVPVYAIPMPDMEWNEESYGPPPELSAEVLAESWDLDELRSRLEPLVRAYRIWIGELRGSLVELSESEREIAEQLIERCEDALNRITRGIDLLCMDDDARLAFCFANKALDIQRRWARGSGLRWRPFQLAYILFTLESVLREDSAGRGVCDLLWVPTGAGKTEAYLAIAALAMAYRRRRARRRKNGDRTGGGVCVITRYTLRLLTIQQFRRALAMTTACEYLRVHGLGRGVPVGWRPSRCTINDDYLWGSLPFSIGLWVGGGVTPNSLLDTWAGRPVPGALKILKNSHDTSEPAQVMNCPACGAILSVPKNGLRPGIYNLHLVVRSSGAQSLRNAITYLAGSYEKLNVVSADLSPHHSDGYFTISLLIDVKDQASGQDGQDIDRLWEALKHKLASVELVAARASRPGYFIRRYRGQRGNEVEYDFEIFCPNPSCGLRVPWCGGAPAGSIHGRPPQIPARSNFPDGNNPIDVQEPFCLNSLNVSDRIPIPALTVDDQIYHRIPSMLVSTVDKFARPPFEPRASTIFGNVEFHHCIGGYYRRGLHYLQVKKGHPLPSGTGKGGFFVNIPPLDPPDLILQDEVHLIEGPLGSLVGFYETAVDFLCSTPSGWRVKYIASSATVRGADRQVRSVFNRKLQVFPPPGLSADDRFFIREREAHSLDDKMPGRLYVGICAPGRGSHTPLVRIWTRLLQTAWNSRNSPSIDAFWTLTGYFNAIRELAGTRALYRDDIKDRISFIARGDPRPLPEDRCVELSGRTRSDELPSILNLLSEPYPNAQDALFTTSMFGTGVDIPRIGMMVVNGQPKTTAAYIQSTGRVGRGVGGLVVTFLRASRPRDLVHYEFFIGYHRQLHRFVESLTVFPFSPGVMDSFSGPLLVFMLRNMREALISWHEDESAPRMSTTRSTAPEVRTVINAVENRYRSTNLLPAQGRDIRQELESKLDRWQNIAKARPDLRYAEYIDVRHSVVLGDARHQYRKDIDVVYPDSPQSLREVEDTVGFEA
ncbi:MAG: DISARM system helicase DrmA [Candidatus Caldarchaeum sp.]